MRRCGVCQRRVVPPRTGSVGRHRFSARTMSVVAYLHILGRLPLRIIQQVLRLLYRVSVSVGELRCMLDAVSAAGAAAYGELKQAIRGSPVVQADETSWREDGQPGYLWAVITPTIRYFERHPSRGGQVIRDLLGEDFTGICACDGYSGYNALDCWKQRCWVHLLRHGHRLTAKYPEATAAHAWVAEMRAIYDAAGALAATPGYAALPVGERESYRLACERRLQAHAHPARHAEIKEWRNLAIFLLDHLNELFVFVQHPEVPSHNNATEQAVRGPVTARKICGGTRSRHGSDSKMTLFSLLQTCQVRGLDPVAAVADMLLGQPLFAAI
jgi:transposase